MRVRIRVPSPVRVRGRGSCVRLGPPANDVVDEGEGEAAAEVAVCHAHEDEAALHGVVEDVRVVHLG